MIGRIWKIHKCLAIKAGVLLALVPGLHVRPCLGEAQIGTAKLAYLRLVSGSIVEPDDETYPVNEFKLDTRQHLLLMRVLIPAAKASGGDLSLGVAAINVVDDHLIEDYPNIMTSSFIFLSTVEDRVIGTVSLPNLKGKPRQPFDDLAEQPTVNVFAHAFAQVGNEFCDLWNLSTASPELVEGKGYELAPDSLRSICTRPKWPPVIHLDRWTDYRNIRLSGQPGGPSTEPEFQIFQTEGFMVGNNAGKPGKVIMRVPTSFSKIRGAELLALRAATINYFVVTKGLRRELILGDKTQDVFFLVKRTNQWKRISIEGNDSLIRIFGDWLAVGVQFVKSQGEIEAAHCGENMVHGLHPLPSEIEEVVIEPSSGVATPESAPAKERLAPQLDIAMNRGCYDEVPGTLLLYNLADGRVIRIDEHTMDTEILEVLDGTSVLFRIEDAIYVAPIHGDKLGERQLVVKDDAVTQIHWAFQAGK